MAMLSELWPTRPWEKKSEELQNGRLPKTQVVHPCGVCVLVEEEHLAPVLLEPMFFGDQSGFDVSCLEATGKEALDASSFSLQWEHALVPGASATEAMGPFVVGCSTSWWNRGVIARLL